MMVTDCTVAPNEQRVGYDGRGKKPSEGQQGRRIKQLRMMKGKFFTTQRHILLIDREAPPDCHRILRNRRYGRQCGCVALTPDVHDKTRQTRHGKSRRTEEYGMGWKSSQGGMLQGGNV